MAKICRLEAFECGLGEVEIAPGSIAKYCRSFNHHANIDELTLTGDLDRIVLESVRTSGYSPMLEIPASEYFGRDKQDELIVRQVRECFRYQDHTQEEYRRVIDLLARHHRRRVGWAVRLGTPFELTLRNDGAVPVRVGAVLRGYYRVAELPRVAGTAD